MSSTFKKDSRVHKRNRMRLYDCSLFEFVPYDDSVCACTYIKCKSSNASSFCLHGYKNAKNEQELCSTNQNTWGTSIARAQQQHWNTWGNNNIHYDTYMLQQQQQQQKPTANHL